MVFPPRLFKTVDKEHKELRHHTGSKHNVAQRQVQYFKQRSQNHHRRPPTVTEIQDTFPPLAGEKHLQPVLICIILSHVLNC
ncbi:hypothetical protein Barb4_03260 [Bacteroidales bacterium Barb4]|nr:hypothetical protein Barb4_03260 [Bacteroidales bacterium Barb4]